MKHNHVIFIVAALVTGLMIGGGGTSALCQTGQGHFWRTFIYQSQYNAIQSIAGVSNVSGFKLEAVTNTIGTQTETIRIAGIDTHGNEVANTVVSSNVTGTNLNFLKIYLWKSQFDAMTKLGGSNLEKFLLTPCPSDASGNDGITITGFDSNGQERGSTNTYVEPCPPNCDIIMGFQRIHPPAKNLPAKKPQTKKPQIKKQ